MKNRYNSFPSSFFIYCSSASKECLYKCPESDLNKYITIGKIILLTSIFAALSASYAVYTVYNSKLISIVFALLWGSLIFNLDRFIVSSMLKSGNIFREFIQALPRIILSFIIAIIMSRPLELSIFEDEINQQLSDNLSLKIEQLSNDYESKIEEKNNEFLKLKEYKTKNITEIIADENATIDKLRQLKKKYRDHKDEAFEKYQCECNGSCGSRQYGDGPRCKERRDKYNSVYIKYIDESDSIDLQIKNKNDYITLLEKNLAEILTKLEQKHMSEVKEIKNEKKKSLSTIQTMFSCSLLSRHQVLWELSLKNIGVLTISIVITLLFIIVETAPVFVKLISQQSPYDLYINYEVKEAKNQILKKELIEKKEIQNKEITDFDDQVDLYKKRNQMKLKKILIKLMAPIEVKRMKLILQEWEKEIFSKRPYISSIQNIFHTNFMNLLKNQNDFNNDRKNDMDQQQKECYIKKNDSEKTTQQDKVLKDEFDELFGQINSSDKLQYETDDIAKISTTENNEKKLYEEIDSDFHEHQYDSSTNKIIAKFYHNETFSKQILVVFTCIIISFIVMTITNSINTAFSAGSLYLAMITTNYAMIKQKE